MLGTSKTLHVFKSALEGYWLELNKEKREFNFNMLETEKANIQLQARYEGPKSEAIGGLAYNIVTVRKYLKKTKRQNKNFRYKWNKQLRRAANTKTRALTHKGSVSPGVYQSCYG